MDCQFGSLSATTAGVCDEIELLLPDNRSLLSPSKEKKKKKSAKRRLERFCKETMCLKGLASPVLYVIKRAKESYRIWKLGDDRPEAAAAGSSEHFRNEVVGVEPFFSIPVVVPVAALV